jgi:CRISPR-associated protein Cas1
VLLRREQHAALSVRARTLEIARNCVAGKIQNSRHVLLRAAREAPESADAETLGLRQSDRHDPWTGLYRPNAQ